MRPRKKATKTAKRNIRISTAIIPQPISSWNFQIKYSPLVVKSWPNASCNGIQTLWIVPQPIVASKYFPKQTLIYYSTFPGWRRQNAKNSRLQHFISTIVSFFHSIFSPPVFNPKRKSFRTYLNNVSA